MTIHGWELSPPQRHDAVRLHVPGSFPLRPQNQSACHKDRLLLRCIEDATWYCYPGG